ncbi:60S ribosomal protein L5 mitochondrial [Bienertia sinuspersici]
MEYFIFGQNLDSNVSLRFSGGNTGKLHSILDGNGVLRILPGTRRSFRDLRTFRGFNVTIVISANTHDETLLPWSGFLQKDEGQ